MNIENCSKKDVYIYLGTCLQAQRSYFHIVFEWFKYLAWQRVFQIITDVLDTIKFDCIEPLI